MYNIGYVGKPASMSMLILFEPRYTFVYMYIWIPEYKNDPSWPVWVKHG